LLQFARDLPGGLALREELPGDRDFLAALYADTRNEELRPVPWSDAEKAVFLGQQFELQWQHYRLHYPRAQWLVILRGGEPIGRLYLEAGNAELRLMDIALLRTARQQGLGTALMRAVLAYAQALGLPVGLHVEPFNPAWRLYQRLGFVIREMHGLYAFLWRGAETDAHDEPRIDQRLPN
jgi:ribosomal protein S18 acetylase RimI-like enzyme